MCWKQDKVPNECIVFVSSRFKFNFLNVIRGPLCVLLGTQPAALSPTVVQTFSQSGIQHWSPLASQFLELRGSNRRRLPQIASRASFVLPGIHTHFMGLRRTMAQAIGTKQIIIDDEGGRHTSRDDKVEMRCNRRLSVGEFFPGCKAGSGCPP